MATTATGWFTSSRSNNGNQCVEVRFDGAAVLIRDSKYRRDPTNRPADEPIIVVSDHEWTAFLRHLAGDPHRLHARARSDGRITLRHGPTALIFTPAEWTAFVAGALAGEFDRISRVI
ncbi:DUF397 domain-containing protein [Nocardia panacis]|uniref:DUF397 domain-containing protein n=1 Tax=Nocardia panacis TaxID=2340916 RepID=A0A3A4KJX7_9NOCA|nr:DUF397 domain-containing protein [Nocardia panacis]RJO76974.1 DUF397 domain-containing protein [Nocardia panacis]